jgi:hypothetical protein
VTRLGARLKRLEDVMAPVSEEPSTITICYVDVNGEVTDEIVVPTRPRIGLTFGKAVLKESGIRL